MPAKIQTLPALLQTAEMVKSEPAQPTPKYRKDYKPTPYLIDKLYLEFSLNEESTKVVATSSVRPNHDGAS
jgi:hypothetical protein